MATCKQSIYVDVNCTESEKGTSEGAAAQLFWQGWGKWPKMSRFLLKKLPNYCLQAQQKQQKYHSADDNCYLKNVC